MNNTLFLYGAYLAFWLLPTFFLFSLVRRQKKIEQKINEKKVV